MPLLIPVSIDEEQPKTYRFSFEMSLNVGTRLEATGLQGSVNTQRGSGTVATFVVVSPIIDGAR
jgi:hypothetical protein